MRSFCTIEKELTHEITIKKSRFICSLKPVFELKEGLIFLREVKKRYPDATHNCYSIVGLPESNEEKTSDDGEPAGTGGMPIKNTLIQNELRGIVCVVTRYFGGIKLGASGLSAAYAKSVIESLAQVSPIEMIWSYIIEVTLSYSEALEANNRFQKEKVIFLGSQYLEKVKVKFGIPCEKKDVFYNILEDITSGKVAMEICSTQYLGYRRETNENNFDKNPKN